MYERAINAYCCVYASLLAPSNFTFVPETDNVGDYSERIPEKAYKKVSSSSRPPSPALA